MAICTCYRCHLFDHLLKLDEICENWLGSSPLMPNARLFLLIAARGSVTIKEAMHSSTLSNRAFYQMIDRLKKEQKISIVKDKQDGRVHRIVLTEILADVPAVLTDKLSNISCFNENLCSKYQEQNSVMA